MQTRNAACTNSSLSCRLQNPGCTGSSCMERTEAERTQSQFLASQVRVLKCSAEHYTHPSSTCMLASMSADGFSSDSSTRL